MNILHITNSYGGTDVYTNLYTAIDMNYAINQYVYVPLAPKNFIREGNKLIEFRNIESKICYSKILKSFHSYFYGLKISKCVRDIESKFDLSKIDLIHANTLCFDGAIAYEINKKYGIPYITAVRNTDVNVYYKRLVWRNKYFFNILNHASRIIFISPRYKDSFQRYQIPAKYQNELSEKMMIIPNGINSMFLSSRNKTMHHIEGPIQVIFVAAFYRGKGLLETIRAIEILRSKGYDIYFNAIGKGLPNRPRNTEYIKEVELLALDKKWIKLQDFKTPAEIIEEMNNSNIFVMVSSPETFGLVYVEALSQGLPIVYTQGQGFDGYYEDGYVGYPALAGNSDSIAKALECVIINYQSLTETINNIDLDKDFSWKNIAEKYFKIYKSVIKK